MVYVVGLFYKFCNVWKMNQLFSFFPLTVVNIIIELFTWKMKFGHFCSILFWKMNYKYIFLNKFQSLDTSIKMSKVNFINIKTYKK